MLVMRLRRSTSYFNAMDDAVAFLSELGRPDLAALLRFSHFTFVGVENMGRLRCAGGATVSGDPA